MRNRIAWLIVFSAVCFSSKMASAQFIHNRLSLYAGVTIETFHGSEFVNEGNFTYPSLMANVKESTGYFVKGLYRARNKYAYGAQLEQREASDWTLEGRDNYTGSTVVLKSLAPTFQYRTGSAIIFGRNELRGVVELSPLVGISHLSLSKPLFEIQNGPQPMESNDSFFGITGCIGFEFDILQSVGLTGTYSYQYNSISSALYVDKHFTSSRLSAGLFLKFVKDKHYFYR